MDFVIAMPDITSGPEGIRAPKDVERSDWMKVGSGGSVLSLDLPVECKLRPLMNLLCLGAMAEERRG